MPELTVEDFKTILLSEPLETVVREYVFASQSYVFRDHPEQEALFLDLLGDRLETNRDDITIVGSAKIGFSLSPHNFPRLFSDESDIDVVVVNETLFDQIWRTILKWHYPRRLEGLRRDDQRWGADRRKDIYWGWLVPDRIRFEGLLFPETLKPLRDTSTAWFNTFRGLSQYTEFSGRDVSGRLYRSWDHALLYHMDGLRQVRESLPSQS